MASSTRLTLARGVAGLTLALALGACEDKNRPASTGSTGTGTGSTYGAAGSTTTTPSTGSTGATGTGTGTAAPTPAPTPAPAAGRDADNTGRNERDRDASRATPMDQGENEADRRITAEIRRAIVGAEGMSVNAQNVKIITRAGVVTLRGPVNSAAERDAVVAKARAVAGVTSVVNELEVTTGD
jgi:hypothetical protein